MLRLLPRLRPRRFLSRGSHGLAARLFAPLILHAAVTYEESCWRPTLAHSHSAKPQSFAFLRRKITGSSSRGGCHTNRADTSHFRERVASTRRAGAVSQRARNASASVVAGRRKKGREERAQEERDLTTLCGGGAASFSSYTRAWTLVTKGYHQSKGSHQRFMRKKKKKHKYHKGR